MERFIKFRSFQERQDQEEPKLKTTTDLHHLLRQPARSTYPGLRTRACPDQEQQPPRKVWAHRNPPSTPWSTPGRGYLHIDANSILNAFAVGKSTGKENNITITNDNGLHPRMTSSVWLLTRRSSKLFDYLIYFIYFCLFLMNIVLIWLNCAIVWQ